MIVYESCPVCDSKNILPVLSVKDHTVSQQLFEIWECRHCTLRFTQDIPEADEMGPYYQSEDYISHSNTQKGIINRLYHSVRKRTLRQKKNLVKKVTGVRRGSLLDVGCGTGGFLHTMQKAGWIVTGLEPEEVARSKAFELYGLQLENPEKLFSLPVESFDAVTMWHVMEHVHDLHGYINQIRSLLKPNGRFIIAVPNYTCYDEEV
ncbi:MAG: class I SAM-dependent methyltransferase, partial [Bacteroidota bacterium]|nr:class I SAM-dependent methyltransferase [Bacteroidota bacterium]